MTEKTNKFEKPKTQKELLREEVLLHDFFILNQGEPRFQGYIAAVLSPEVVMVELWPEGQRDKALFRYYALTEMKWDWSTDTGFVFGPRSRPNG